MTGGSDTGMGKVGKAFREIQSEASMTDPGLRPVARQKRHRGDHYVVRLLNSFTAGIINCFPLQAGHFQVAAA